MNTNAYNNGQGKQHLKRWILVCRKAWFNTWYLFLEKLQLKYEGRLFFDELSIATQI